MNAAIIAGLLFRQTLERLPIDMRALGEMLGCVDDNAGGGWGVTVMLTIGRSAAETVDGGLGAAVA